MSRQETFGPRPRARETRPRVLQVAYAEDNAVGTTTTLLPSDDTIPQSNEGAEFMTLEVVPKHANSTFFIEMKGQFGVTASGRCTLALFKDSDANALSAGMVTIEANQDGPVYLSHKLSRSGASLAPVTFKMRAGLNTSATVTFNGAASARLYGGVFNSYIKVTEVLE